MISALLLTLALYQNTKVMAKKQNLTGKVYGKLTVISLSDKKVSYGRLWLCQCNCGQLTNVSTANLNSSHITGCSACRGIKHGLHNSPEYRSYFSMKQRCYNKNYNYYKIYGGRGIIVCDRWLNSFENFFSDMGCKPSKKHSLDRKEVNGNYEPSNCRWATPTEQANNKRNTIFLEYKGESLTRYQIAKKYNIRLTTLQYRLETGLSISEAVERPVAIYQYKKSKQFS